MPNSKESAALSRPKIELRVEEQLKRDKEDRLKSEEARREANDRKEFERLSLKYTGETANLPLPCAQFMMDHECLNVVFFS